MGRRPSGLNGPLRLEDFKCVPHLSCHFSQIKRVRNTHAPWQPLGYERHVWNLLDSLLFRFLRLSDFVPYSEQM